MTDLILSIKQAIESARLFFVLLVAKWRAKQRNKQIVASVRRRFILAKNAKALAECAPQYVREQIHSALLHEFGRTRLTSQSDAVKCAHTIAKVWNNSMIGGKILVNPGVFA
jgi:hypothetical protein